MIQKLSLIIPAFNEETTITTVLSTLINLDLINQIEKEIIVVNDFSSDSTRQKVTDFIAKNPNHTISLFNQPSNQGKGAALHLGIEKASGDYLIPQDADLELDPADINILLKKALDEKLDVVYGSRFINNNTIEKNTAYWANQLLTKFSNLMSGLQISDMETCYKLVRTAIAKNLTLKEKHFGFEPEITAKLAKVKGITIGEVPITYNSRTHEEGKKIGWKDGVKALYCIVRYNL